MQRDEIIDQLITRKLFGQSESLVLTDGLEEAFMGVTSTTPTRAIYDYWKCLDIIIKSNKNLSKTQKLRLIEPDHEELQVPNVEFSSIINLPSSDFQKIIRDLSPLSDKLEIKSLANELIFRCAGSFATAEIRRAESDGSLEFQLKPDNSKIIQGEFSLKNLGYFIKCTNLCSQIEMFLENDLPLVVKYHVASLGEIKLCLAPLPSS